MTTNFWQGERVRLRAIEPGDAAFFFRCDLDSERGRMLDFLWPPSSMAALHEWIEKESRRKMEDGGFHWVMEVGGEAVGTIATHHCNPRSGTFSYGVDVAHEHRGKGYAGEAIRMVVRYYFHELRYQKVTTSVHADNPASIRMHEKLGFQREGVLRRMVFTGGRYVDEIYFGMTAEEFARSLQP